MSAADPDFRHVLFLAHFDGADNGTTFTAVTGQAITRTNFVTKTGVKKFGTASAYAPGNGSLTFPTTADARWAFGTNDFTIESWIDIASGSSGTRAIINKFTTWSTSVDFVFEVDSSGYLRFYCGDNIPVDLISDSALSTNTWIHVAVTRASNVFRLFVDGVQQADSVTDSVSIANNRTTAAIGSNGYSANYWNGYLDDLRITCKARYTATFTPPSEAFPDHGYGTAALYPLSIKQSIARKVPLQTVTGKQRIMTAGRVHSSMSRACGIISGTITESLAFAHWIIAAHNAVTGAYITSQVTATGAYSLRVPLHVPVMVTCHPAIDYHWLSNNKAVAGDLMVPSNPGSTPYVYRCTTGGMTGATEPTWGTTPGGTTSDGTAVWTCLARLSQPAIQGPLVAA